MRNHDKPRRHKLDDRDAEVFVPHCVDTDEGFLVALQQLLIRRVHFELDVFVKRQMLRKVLEVLNSVEILLVTARAYENETNATPQVFVVYQKRPKLVQTLKYELKLE